MHRAALVIAAALALAPAAAQTATTPAGGCDWIVAPQRDSSEQNVLIGVRGECPTVAVRQVGSLSEHQMSTVFICQAMTQPREYACTVPVQTLGRPVEIKIFAEEPRFTVDVWVAEGAQNPPPTPVPPEAVPIEGGGAYLKWRVPQDPVIRWFEFESAAPDTSPTGSTAPSWVEQDRPDAWTYCTSVLAPSGRRWFACTREVPYTGRRYRVRACNWSGPNATAGCSAWAEEAYLTCTQNGGTGCPCLTLPSPSGCVP